MRATGALLAAVLALAACGEGSQNPHRAHVLEFSLHSRLLDRSLDEVGVVPRGGGRRPLLVLLQGYGESPEDYLWNELFSGLSRLGRRAPAVVVANGGKSSYYHDRRDAPWGSYVLSELIPTAVHLLGADRHRVAIGGISMGGFGALDLARLHPRRFCAVGGHSAAVWRTGSETPAVAFDDAEDFARHDVFGSAQRGNPFGATPVWIDAGRNDPFYSADTELAHLLQSHGGRVQLHTWSGNHGPTYWRAHLHAYLRFYANACSR